MSNDYARAGTERRDSEYCRRHETNSNDLASLKSSTSTIKWVVGLVLPFLVVIIGGWVGTTYNSLQDTLKEVKGDVHEIKESVTSNTISAASLRAEVLSNSRAVQGLDRQMHQLHRSDRP